MAEESKAGTSLVPAHSADPASSLARIGLIAKDVSRRCSSIPPARRNRMIATFLLVAAVCASLIWYAGRTDWRVLFSGLDAKDIQQIAQELSAANIPYQLTIDGSGVEVGADQLEKARMEIATKGMPQSGRMGFELFDKPNWVGSEFDEKVNYQRALEGELEHTIGTLSAVRSARVHLALPKESLFDDSNQVAKASVVLQLKRPVLPPDQAEAIRALLAGAVESLSPENVALVDADGRLDLRVPGRGASGADLEHSLEEKLVAMLEPTAGSGNVRATVNVLVDEASQEKTDEVYDPSQTATLTLHKSEQTAGARPNAAGFPGTDSNTPGPQEIAKTGGRPPLMEAASSALTSTSGATKNANLPVYPLSAGQNTGETLKEEAGSYVVTKHLLHSEQGPGTVRRVTAAVLVNDRSIIEGSGKATHAVWKQRSPEEMQRMEQLARAAIGYDPARGDQVVIEDVSFLSNQPEEDAPAIERVVDRAGSLMRQEPGLWKAAGLSVLAVILIMAVVRPIASQMMASIAQSAIASPVGQTGAQIGPSGVSGVISLGQLAEPGTELNDVQAVYKHITERIRNEPVQSTRLLESWIAATVEED